MTTEEDNAKYALAIMERDKTIAELVEALNAYAYQAETVAGLSTCGEVTFLRGLAKAMRITITKATAHK